MTSIGSRLRSARNAKKLTQSQLGEAVGRTKGAISQWENNEGQPDLQVLAVVCDVLQVSADYIVRGLNVPHLDPRLVELAMKLQAIADSPDDPLASAFKNTANAKRVAQFLKPAPRIKPE